MGNSLRRILVNRTQQKSLVYKITLYCCYNASLLYNFPQIFLEINFADEQQFALLVITFSILVYNITFHYLRQFVKLDADKFNPLHLSILQMIFDLTALMLIVYFTGSVESPLLLFFVIHMIVGSLIYRDLLSILLLL